MRAISFVAVVAVALAGSAVSAQDFSQNSSHGNGNRVIRVEADLRGVNEVPSVSSPAAQGKFTAEIDTQADEISFEMTFSGLQANVTQSHIHFAAPRVNGGIVIWLCGTATNPGPAGTQTCPQSGTITGTIHGTDIQNVPAQGIATGDFDEIVAAIRAGLAYANIHTVQSPGGEMRGQIRLHDQGHR